MAKQNRELRQLSRREMLRLSGLLAAGGLLAATRPAAAQETTEAPSVGSADVSGHVVSMTGEDINDEMLAQFQELYPNISVEVVEPDQTSLFAMFAAGNPPDLVRVQAPAIPQYLARDLLFDLTPYFEASTLVPPDDLAAANNYYRANSPLEIGTGPIYGMVKDWSPDFTLFVYTQAFEDKGIELPDDTTPLTYEEAKELGAQLATFEGDRTLLFGFDYPVWWIDRIWMNLLAETGDSLYTEDFTQMQLVDNEPAREVLQYFLTLAEEKITNSPINPSPDWDGGDFTKGQVGMIQYGYWFGAMAESDVTTGLVRMLPAPTWAGVRRDPTMTATGMIVTKTTQVPDAAWSLFEYYMGGQPALDRAASGWGIPALVSQFDLLPTDTEYNQQRLRVVQGEIDLATEPLQFNPYLGDTAVSDAWAQNQEQALTAGLSFDELLENIEFTVNTAIEDGRSAIE